MSDFNYKKYLKNNPLLQKEAEGNKLITEEKTTTEEMSNPVMRKGEKGDDSIEKETEKMRMKEVNESASVLAGMGALLGSTAGLAKLLNYWKKNYPDQVDKFVKMVDKGNKASYSRLGENEAEVNENIGQGDALISNGREGEGAEDVIIKYTDVEAYPDKPRNDGMFSIALKAERMDGEKFQGEDELTVYFMINPEKTQIDSPRILKGDGKSDLNFKPEMKEYGKTLKFINDNYKDMSEGYGKKYEEDDIKKEEMSSKMKKSDLKAKIKEDIISLLQEDEIEYETPLEEEEEVEIDIEDKVEVEEPELDASVAQTGLSDDEKEIQDALKLAYDNAQSIGDEKLADQIGNSITFFTRTHVVER